MGNNFYDEEMYDLDPNYDESNAELDRYEREADYYAAECAEGVTVRNYADVKDQFADCFITGMTATGSRRTSECST